MAAQALFDPLRQFCVAKRCAISADIEAISIASMGGGKGVVAKKRLSPGSKIVSVPMDLMLTARSARRYISALPSQRNRLEDVRQLTAVEAISSFLILCERDTEHPFHLWVKGLPRAYDNLLELPADSLEQCIWSPRLREKVLLEQEAFRTAYGHVMAAVPELSNLSPSDDIYSKGIDVVELREEQARQGNPPAACFAKLQLSKYLWAYNSLMSRGFSYDDDIWCMMPWVDYFNFSLHPNVTMSFSPATKTYDFFTKAPIKAGEQLMLQYGRYSDFELLMWYGFTLRPILFPQFSAQRDVKSPSVRVSSKQSQDGKKVADGSRSGSDDESDKDAEAVDELATVCAYVFSPTSDPNGDYPIGTVWAVNVAKSANLAVPPEWLGGAEQIHDNEIHDARVGLLVVSDGMKALVRKLHAANDALSPAEILRRIVVAELAAMEPEDAAQRAVVGQPANGDSSAVSRMALRMSMDQRYLLETFAKLEASRLSRLLSQ